MKTHQSLWTAADGWLGLERPATPPSLVLLFGGRRALSEGPALDELAKFYPRAHFFGCSTAGEILGERVHDETVAATALWFERATVDASLVSLDDCADLALVGERLVAGLSNEGLVHVLVLSDGTSVNGTALVNGVRSALPANVTISGGLSGDGAEMKSTVVCARGEVRSHTVAAIGFHGPLEVGLGSYGGWNAFGPLRTITKSEGAVLSSLDGEPALALYKRYLGEHAAGLPSSALLFPLLVTSPGTAPIVRTILGVDEATGTMTFAGDVPEGSTAQLMRANFDRLVAAGEDAGLACRGSRAPQFALLISCVGRKLILKQRVEEEVEAVRHALGADATTTGFYSYGELAPTMKGEPCQLHNQTMTVTTFAEL